MAQSTFQGTLKALFFDVEINTKDPQLLLMGLQSEKRLSQQKRVSSITSLGTSLEMNTGKKATRKTYVFQMLESPLVSKNFERGFMKLVIGETQDQSKVLDINWTLQFSNLENAESFFLMLNFFFTPLSTLHNIDESDWPNYGKYAEYSTRKENNGITDIAILLTNITVTSTYEIQILLFNNFLGKN